MSVRILTSICCALMIFSLVACSETDSVTESPPDILRIGLLPDEDPETLKQRFTPLAKYLSTNLEIPFELIIPADYNDLVEQFAKGNLDITYFGGLTFLQAQQRADAVPLVMRDIDVHFSSYFLARTHEHPENLSDFKGSSFSFGSQLSTSGHLMPRYFLGMKGITPEDFFSEVSFSGAHDKTALLVSDGAVDLGAANAHIVDSMYANGQLNPNDVHIVWKTPPYADYVWAVRPDIGESFSNKLLNLFLSLSSSNEQHHEILNKLGAGGFIPAHLDDFEALREVALKTGLLKIQDTD